MSFLRWKNNLKNFPIFEIFQLSRNEVWIQPICELVKELLVHPFHEVKCDGISCSWDEDFKTCNCILSPVRGNGLFRIHQALYLDENLQYEISPIAKIDQPFIFIGFQGEMSAFNFLIYDWSTGLSGFKSLYFLLVVAESAKQHLYQLLQARKTEMMVIVEQLWATSTPGMGFPVGIFHNHRLYLNGPVSEFLS